MDEQRRPRSPENRGTAATRERPRRPGPQPPRRQSGTTSDRNRERQQRLSERNPATDRSRSSADRTRERQTERVRERQPERTREREPERTREREPVRVRERQPERTRERQPARREGQNRNREPGHKTGPEEAQRRQRARKPEPQKAAPKRKKRKPHRIYNTNFGFKFVTMLAVVGVIVLAMLIFFKVKHINVIQTGVNNENVLAHEVTPPDRTETTSPTEVEQTPGESAGEGSELSSAATDTEPSASAESAAAESAIPPEQTEASPPETIPPAPQGGAAVEGSFSYYTPEEIVAASGISIDDNLLSLSKAAVASRIHAELPYINEIQIRKKLPNTVIITVSEFTVTYGIQDEHGLWWLISREGRVLQRADDRTVKDHMIVTGMPIEAPQVGDYIRPMATPGADLSEIAAKRDAILATLPLLEQASFAKEIVSLDVSTSYDLIVWYGTQFEVKLGNTENLTYKLNYLASVLAELGSDKSGTIDLTFTEDNKGHFLPFG